MSPDHPKTKLSTQWNKTHKQMNVFSDSSMTTHQKNQQSYKDLIANLKISWRGGDVKRYSKKKKCQTSQKDLSGSRNRSPDSLNHNGLKNFNSLSQSYKNQEETQFETQNLL